MTSTVIETALDDGLSEHLGYDKHAPEGRNRGNSRNGARTKTVLTDNCGPVEVTVPRDLVPQMECQHTLQQSPLPRGESPLPRGSTEG